MRREATYMLVALPLLLGACAAIPPHQDPAVKARPYPLAATLEKSGGSGGFVAGQWPAEAWWKTFQDPQLDRLMDVALAQNPDLKIAAARVQLAGQQVALARAALRPTAGLGGQVQRERFSANGMIPPPYGGTTQNQGDLSLDFNYDLDWWNKHGDALRAALDEKQAAEADRAEARLLVSTALVQAYVRLQGDESLARIARETLSQRQGIRSLVARRAEAGLENALAVHQSDAEVETAAARVDAFRRAVTLDRQAVLTLAGIGPDGTDQVAASSARIPIRFALPPRLSLDLLARRPDIMAQTWRVEAAAARIQVARAGFYPNINLGAAAGFESIDLAKLLSSQSLTASAGIAVHLPIFETRTLQAQLRTRYGEYDLAVEEYNKRLLHAAAEVAAQLTTLAILQTEQTHQAAAQAAAEQAFQVAGRRYRAGLTGFLAVLQSERDVLAAKESAARLEQARMESTVALIRALGGGYSAPEQTEIENGRE